jgi:hypothetical protein
MLVCSEDRNSKKTTAEVHASDDSRRLPHTLMHALRRVEHLITMAVRCKITQHVTGFDINIAQLRTTSQLSDHSKRWSLGRIVMVESTYKQVNSCELISHY